MISRRCGHSPARDAPAPEPAAGAFARFARSLTAPATGSRAGAPLVVALTLALVLAWPASALQDPGNPVCIKVGEGTPEVYGPTDIGATLANSRLQVAENAEGTLSVFRWPTRSFYEQLKYMTIDRDLPRLGLAPNEGAFSGLALKLRGGTDRFVWLRELRSSQRYMFGDSDTVQTTYRSPELGLRLIITDVIAPGRDVLMRRHTLLLTAGTPVRTARLIAFANFNPTASKRPVFPTEDWCEEVSGTDRARYRADADAIVYSISELDTSTLESSSAAVAIGADVRSDGHQIGADRYAPHPGAGTGPQSAYDDAADGELSGADRHGAGEVDAALSLPFRRGGVTVVFAAGSDANDAVRRLQRARHLEPATAIRAQRRSYRRWIAEAPLPAGAPDAVTRLAKRALVSLRQAIELRAGRDRDKVAIVASLATQSPYFLDWIRDGAFFNEALDLIGHHGLVRRHNLFYAEVQKKEGEGAPPGSPLHFCEGPTPAGNWFMTNYVDGGDAGIFSWEIDEAAFGLWTLWRHYEWLERRDRDGRAYLDRIYPALRRTAEFLVAFRDPATGLPPGTACEDDNPPRPGQPTMHSAGPVLLAMRSAERAALALGRDSDAARYAARRAELDQAIDSAYDAGDGAWTDDYGDGGWAVWPVRVKPFGHPRTRAQAELIWQRVKPSFQAPGGSRRRGQYEAKALHALAHFYRRVDPARLERVKRGLRWIAEVQASYQDTGILGETWRVDRGSVISVVSQPHVWAQVLFYLAAIKAYGKS